MTSKLYWNLTSLLQNSWWRRTPTCMSLGHTGCTSSLLFTQWGRWMVACHIEGSWPSLRRACRACCTWTALQGKCSRTGSTSGSSDALSRSCRVLGGWDLQAAPWPDTGDKSPYIPSRHMWIQIQSGWGHSERVLWQRWVLGALNLELFSFFTTFTATFFYDCPFKTLPSLTLHSLACFSIKCLQWSKELFRCIFALKKLWKSDSGCADEETQWLVCWSHCRWGKRTER